MSKWEELIICKIYLFLTFSKIHEWLVFIASLPSLHFNPPLYSRLHLALTRLAFRFCARFHSIPFDSFALVPHSQFAVYRFTLMGVLFSAVEHSIWISAATRCRRRRGRFMLYLDGECFKRFLYFDWIIYSNSFYYLTYIESGMERIRSPCVSNSIEKYYIESNKICVANWNGARECVHSQRYRRRWLKGAYMNLYSQNACSRAYRFPSAFYTRLDIEWLYLCAVAAFAARVPMPMWL